MDVPSSSSSSFDTATTASDGNVIGKIKKPKRRISWDARYLYSYEIRVIYLNKFDHLALTTEAQ